MQSKHIHIYDIRLPRSYVALWREPDIVACFSLSFIITIHHTYKQLRQAHAPSTVYVMRIHILSLTNVQNFSDDYSIRSSYLAAIRVRTTTPTTLVAGTRRRHSLSYTPYMRYQSGSITRVSHTKKKNK